MRQMVLQQTYKTNYKNKESYQKTMYRKYYINVLQNKEIGHGIKRADKKTT